MNQIAVYFPPRHKELTALGYTAYHCVSQSSFYALMTQFGSPYTKNHNTYMAITGNYKFPTQVALVSLAYFINNMNQCNNNIKSAIFYSVLIAHRQVMQRLMRKKIPIQKYQPMTNRFVNNNYDKIYDTLYHEALHIAKQYKGLINPRLAYTSYDSSNGWYSKLLNKPIV